MELSRAPRLALTSGRTLGASVLGGGAAGGGGGGAGGMDDAPETVGERRWSLVMPGMPCPRGLQLRDWTWSVLH